MGLDMYLYKAKKVYDKQGNPINIADLDPDELKTQNPELYEYLRPYEITRGEYAPRQSYVEKIGYWRKANHIHRWFVENVQGGVDECQMSPPVTEEKLTELLNICEKIKEACKLVPGRVKNGEILKGNRWVSNYEEGKVITNPEVAESLLPTMGGFFFGGTDYDEYYMQDIDDTIEILTKVLAETDFEKEDIFYHSSW